MVGSEIRKCWIDETSNRRRRRRQRRRSTTKRSSAVWRSIDNREEDVVARRSFLIAGSTKMSLLFGKYFQVIWVLIVVELSMYRPAGLGLPPPQRGLMNSHQNEPKADNEKSPSPTPTTATKTSASPSPTADKIAKNDSLVIVLASQDAVMLDSESIKAQGTPQPAPTTEAPTTSKPPAKGRPAMQRKLY